MLFNFKSKEPGVASAQPSETQNPYNRFYNHSDRQKDQSSLRKKNVRFSNDTNLRKTRKKSEDIGNMDPKAQLKK